MASSSVTKQTEEILEETLHTIQQEYDDCPVLCETDRNKFVEEEGSLREQLKATIELESKSLRRLLSLPSPQAAKCLKEAEELRQRVKEAINNSKLRTRTDAPLAEGNPEPASTMITSPPNMRCSLEASEANINPTVQNDHDYTSGISEAINSPLEMSSESSDRSRNSCSRHHRRPPPPPPQIASPPNIRLSLSEPEVSALDSSSRRHRRPPPLPPQIASPPNIRLFLSEPEVSALETSSESGDQSRDSSSRRRRRSPPPPRRMSQSGNPRLLSDSSSNSGSDTPRRSHSIRRPAPPPPQSPRQSSTPRSPTNVSFSSPGPSSPDPAMFAMLAQQLGALASSLVADSRSRQAKGRHGLGSSVDYITMTNCVDINGSNIDGLTMNNGGKNNTGAVIHKTMMPPHPLPLQAKGWQKIRGSDDYITKTNCVDINGSNVEGLTMNNGGTGNSGAVIHKTMVPSPRLPRHVS